MLYQRITSRLSLRSSDSLYRNPILITERDGKYIHDGKHRFLNFSSNDYLGLAASASVREVIAQAFCSHQGSSSSSRLICGNYALITEAEKAYAEYFGYEDALFLPSGYQANIALIATLFEKGDYIFFDKHIHSSLEKGIILSGAEAHGYNHNRFTHLETRLRTFPCECSALVTESLFSMDGDIPDFSHIAMLKQKHNIFVIIDEAHSFGMLGNKGKGLGRQVSDIATGTFGKALHLFGAFILLPRICKEYLLNFGSPVLYSTALPQAHAAAAIDILRIVEQSDIARERCLEISEYLRKALITSGFTARGDSHIIIIDIGDEKRAVSIERRLRTKGIFLHAIRFPTVPISKAILRISMTALHDKNDVHMLLKALTEIQNEK